MATQPAEIRSSFTSDTALLQRDLLNSTRSLASWDIGGEQVRLIKGLESLWLLFGPDNAPYLALRAAYFADSEFRMPKRWAANNGDLNVSSLLGQFRIAIHCEFRGLPTARVRCWLRPSHDLLGTNWPRDLFPIGPTNDPSAAKGKVEAAQSTR